MYLGIGMNNIPGKWSYQGMVFFLIATPKVLLQNCSSHRVISCADGQLIFALHKYLCADMKDTLQMKIDSLKGLVGINPQIALHEIYKSCYECE